MRIALVSPYDFAFPGGVTSHIAHLDESFRAAGHEVAIIAPCSLSAEQMARPNLEIVGRPVPIPARGSVARVTLSLRLAKKVKAILDDHQFEIVHLHEPLAPALPITVLRMSDSINIGTFHSYAGGSWAYFYGRRILKRWFRKLHGKIAVSPPAMRFVSNYFPGYYNIIPNGIDYQRFARDVPKLEQYDDGKLNILFVGRLEKRKGLKYLLRAFAYVKRQVPNCRLIVVGPGERLRSGYSKIIRQSGVTDVEFVGFVPDEELSRYYRTADVFCSPATGQESFGIVLLEAMAAGTAIVASNIDGFASVMTHGAEGLLVPPKDEQELALSLVNILADDQERHRMAAAGRVKARDYSWDRVSSRVLSYYERLLGEDRPRQRRSRGMRSSVAQFLRYARS